MTHMAQIRDIFAIKSYICSLSVDLFTKICDTVVVVIIVVNILSSSAPLYTRCNKLIHGKLVGLLIVIFV